MKPVQVGWVAKEVIKLIRSTIPTTIEVRSNIKSDSRIMGNATQLHQIFMNLCTNGAQAMEQAGGLLEVTIMDVELNSNHTMCRFGLEPGHYIEINVTDSGVGIPQEIISNIYAPYFTTKDPGVGTGMGLAVVNGIVESYGGKIEVKSEQGKGSSFSLFLSLVKKNTIPVLEKQENIAGGKERLLFVDDEESIVKMGRQLLESLGYSVTTCISGVEALTIFHPQPDNFDHIITDMTMPKMTGDQLVASLRKIRSDIPIILCNGYSKQITDQSLKEMKVNAFAYKPIVTEGLAAIIREALGDV